MLPTDYTAPTHQLISTQWTSTLVLELLTFLGRALANHSTMQLVVDFHTIPSLCFLCTYVSSGYHCCWTWCTEIAKQSFLPPTPKHKDNNQQSSFLFIPAFELLVDWKGPFLSQLAFVQSHGQWTNNSCWFCFSAPATVPMPQNDHCQIPRAELSGMLMYKSTVGMYVYVHQTKCLRSGANLMAPRQFTFVLEGQIRTCSHLELPNTALYGTRCLLLVCPMMAATLQPTSMHEIDFNFNNSLLLCTKKLTKTTSETY